MEKQLLVEYISPSVSNLTILNEGKRDAEGRIVLRGKLQQADEKNGNGRVYPVNVLKEKVAKYIKESVNTKTAMGELDHPDSQIINLNNVSHIINRIWWEDDNVMGELTLLNTPSGKIAQELITAGIPLGISSRGMGSVKQIGETVEVQDDFELLCWDLVSVPSTPQAYMRLSEGKMNNSYDKYNKINSLITDIICTSTGVCHLC